MTKRPGPPAVRPPSAGSAASVVPAGSAAPAGSSVPAASAGVVFGVLGPVQAESPYGPVALKGHRQRSVLARLLTARGRVVPVDRLVTDLWVAPPDGAVAAIRTFVADLRRALEPDRPSRAPARLLVTAPPGYALRAEPDAVDAWRFEAAVADSAALLASGRAGAALARLDGALALWRGPAYAEVAGEGWARGEINRLDELRMLAVERRAEALLALGRPAEAASDLRPHAADEPLREGAWSLLATALYQSGRQGEALAALREARETLVAELGVDPGPRLRRLEADILAQAPHLSPGEPHPGTPATTLASSSPFPSGPVASGGVAPPGGVAVLEGREPVVGRGPELASLERAAEHAVRHGRPTLALISGEAGAGKTALADALTRRLSAAGWKTAWGRSPEYDGAPVAWPWVQITGALAGANAGPVPSGPAPVPSGARSAPAGPALAPPEIGVRGPEIGEDPAVARFRLRRAAGALITRVAAGGAVLLVLDDLHRADEDTLDLLTGLLGEPEQVSGPVLVVGSYRATGITPELTGALARLARTEPVRLYLGGLSETATGELASAVIGDPLDADAVRLIHERSGGNPFFVRELARLFEAEGVTALRTVPAGVRDVIRHRLNRLPDRVRTVLRQASVLGRDIDPDVLVALTGGDPARVLDALEHALDAGFLAEYGTGQDTVHDTGHDTGQDTVHGTGHDTGQDAGGRLRFTHILVRDTIYGDLSAPRRARWHAAAGAALERLRFADVAALAYHFTLAGSRATAPRAAHYSRATAERAERDCNPHRAVRLWRQAIAAHDRAGGGDVPGRLDAVLGCSRALAVTGHLAEARRLRSTAVTTAAALPMATALPTATAVTTVTGLEDTVLTARLLTAFDVPAIWTRNDDEHLSRQIVRAVEHTLTALPSEDEAATGVQARRPGEAAALRGRLLSALALELRGSRTDRGHRAAVEAEEIARRLADPKLLAFALNARFMHAFRQPGLAAERAGIGAELVDLSARHELVTFEVLGHLILLQAHSALADLATADAHAAAADRLADRYDLPLVGVFTQWYGALRLALVGDLTGAEAAYRTAHARLAGGGMPGMERGLLPLALLSLRLREHDGPLRVPVGAPANHSTRGSGRRPAYPTAGDWPSWDYGPELPWVRPLVLLAAGRRDEAATALRARPQSPHDLLHEVRLCLAGRAAVALGDRAAMHDVYIGLLPAAGELAGAGSGVLSLGPVADHLGYLAAALGRHDEAATHRRTARALMALARQVEARRLTPR